MKQTSNIYKPRFLPQWLLRPEMIYINFKIVIPHKNVLNYIVFNYVKYLRSINHPDYCETFVKTNDAHFMRGMGFILILYGYWDS